MAKLGDKYAIGTEHVIDGKTVIVEEAKIPNLCDGCEFNARFCNVQYCLLPIDLKGRSPFHFSICYDIERTDGKNVIFRRKEQQ